MAIKKRQAIAVALGQKTASMYNSVNASSPIVLNSNSNATAPFILSEQR